jgi:hypothetical protein
MALMLFAGCDDKQQEKSQDVTQRKEEHPDLEKLYCRVVVVGDEDTTVPSNRCGKARALLERLLSSKSDNGLDLDRLQKLAPDYIIEFYKEDSKDLQYLLYYYDVGLVAVSGGKKSRIIFKPDKKLKEEILGVFQFYSKQEKQMAK